MRHCRTSPWLGASHSAPPKILTSYTIGTARGGGSRPTGPLSCPACGSAQSGTRGRSGLNPSPGTPPLVTPCHEPPKGRISYTSGALPVVGVVGTSKVPPSHHTLADWLSGNLQLGPLCNQERGRTGVVFPNGYYPNPSSRGCRPLWSAFLWCERVNKSQLPSSPCWYVSTPDQITPSGRGYSVSSLPPLLT